MPVRNGPAVPPGGIRLTTAERLADEAPLAIGTVVYRALDHLRRAEHQLELEAADPRVDALRVLVHDARLAGGALLVEVAAEAVER